MEIRVLYPSDIEQLKAIHERFYKNEFDFPDFYDKFLCAFTVLENEHIICSGGVRTIAESVIITNKEFDIASKREALYKMLEASLFTIGKCNYNELHAFIQDEKWLRHLLKVGFKSTKGDSLVLSV